MLVLCTRPNCINIIWLLRLNCNQMVVSSLDVGYHPPPKNHGTLQGRVRQLPLRQSLGGLAWMLYKCEVPQACIPVATSYKGVNRISPHTLGTRDHAITCHKHEEWAFPVSSSISWVVSHFTTKIHPRLVGYFIYLLDGNRLYMTDSTVWFRS